MSASADLDQKEADFMGDSASMGLHTKNQNKVRCVPYL
jgi:hypothetical protein